MSSCAATAPAVCYQFVDSSAVAFLQPTPALTPTTFPQSAMATPAQYSVAVRDAAQNSTATVSFGFRYDYLDCVQPTVNHSTVISFSANPTQNCFGCHSAITGPNPTPATTLVVVPPPSIARAKYWCRRPS